jgi:hypothetical protein
VTLSCGGLVRYRRDDDGRIDDVDYYARGIGWTSYGAARTSWTGGEQRDVVEWRRRNGVRS